MNIFYFIKISILFFLLSNVIIEGARDIYKPEYSAYISSIIELRSPKLQEKIDQLKDFLSPPESDDDFFAFTSAVNSLSATLGIMGAIPGPQAPMFGAGCGIAALISSTLLSITQNAIDSSTDSAKKVSQGVQELIGENLDDYNVDTLKDIISGAQELIDRFIENNMGKNGIMHPNDDLVDIINDGFIKDKYLFGYVDTTTTNLISTSTASIGLFTIYANTHLLFLSDIINNYDFYNLEASKITFINDFKSFTVSYRNYIDAVEEKGEAVLMQKILNDGIRNQDKWNKINEYRNYFSVYCYDFANYWFAMDISAYPTGMMIENARVTISNILGSAFGHNGAIPLTYDELVSLLNSRDIISYKGSLKGINFRTTRGLFKESNPDTPPSGLVPVKFFQSIIYNSDTNKEYLSVPVGNPVPGQDLHVGYLDEKDVTDISSPSYFSSVPTSVSWRDYRDEKDDDHSQYAYDVGFDLTNLGSIKEHGFGALKDRKTSVEEPTVFKSGSLRFPGKKLNGIYPTTYNKCFIRNWAPFGAEIKIIEGFIFGFVGEDIKDENVIIDGTSSMVDAQKYFFSSNQINYITNGVSKYLGGIQINAGTRVVYKLAFKSMDGTPQKFRIQARLKVLSGVSATLKFNRSYGTENGCLIKVDEISFSGTNINSAYILDISQPITLLPEVDNYLIIDVATNSIILSSLIFIAI